MTTLKQDVIDSDTTHSFSPIANSTPNIPAKATLLDWLYLPDPVSLKQSQGALIVFPHMLDRWNVSSLILSKWEGHKVFVVTDHPEEFTHAITDPNTDWTNLELIPFPILKYSDIADINKSLRNTEIDVILFDDARMLSTISPGLDFSLVHPKIIVLTSWGDTYTQLDLITSKLPDLQLLYLDIISDAMPVRWDLVKVPMSSRQLKFYDQIRQRELSSSDTPFEINPTSGENSSDSPRDSPNYMSTPIMSKYKIPYPMSRMVTLYVYPDIIMADTLKHKTICETDQSTFPDTLDDPNTWLTTDTLDSLNANGPKLESVLDGVVSNWPNKQIVSTRFNHRYGVDLIVSLLHLMHRANNLPYESIEIFHISCTDDYETIANTLHKFNASESAVLVTNIIPLIPLKGVTVVHVVDSYSFPTLKMIIDRCHKRHLSAPGINHRVISDHSKGSYQLTIYFYVSTHPTEISSDSDLYTTLSNNIIESNRLYSGLIRSSGRIVFNPVSGLLVL